MTLVNSLSDFFIFRFPARTRDLAPAATAAEEAQGVFVDPKSLASFPIAAAIATTLSKIAVRWWSGADILWVALPVALLVGALIFAITISDASARPKKLLEWVIAIAIATVNALMLYATVIGIDQLQKV